MWYEVNINMNETIKSNTHHLSISFIPKRKVQLTNMYVHQLFAQHIQLLAMLTFFACRASQLVT